MTSRGSSPTREGENGDEKPVSISSLRAKFETLAAAGIASNANAGPSTKKAVQPKPVIAAKPVGLRSAQPSRSTTPAPQIDPRPAASPASSTQETVQPTPSLQPVAPAKPAIISTPASPEPPALPGESTGSPIAPSADIAAPIPTSPKPIRRAAPAIPSKAPSPSPSPAPSAPPALPTSNEPEPVASVKTLRERFSGAATTEGAPKPAVAPRITASPAISRSTSSASLQIPATSETQSQSSTPPQLTASPVKTEGQLFMERRAPPPPPISRAASPAPPQPDRSTKPIPTIPQQSPSVSTPPDSSGTSPGATPPALPIRRPTISQSSESSTPPPIPGNRPNPSTRRGNSAEESAAPPRLPQRSRAQTVGRPDTFQGATPPRLPTRGLGPTNSLPQASSSYPPSPQPEKDADTFVPLPPPTRSNTISLAPPKASKDEEYASSEEEEGDDPSVLANLSASAKRALEDFPDSTHANRRPPKFVPDIRMIQPHHIYAFAVFGRHVCTGAHHVRVYDTQMSEKPIFIIDMKDAGIDHRIKDPKVTALGFRPGCHPDDEGRFLWCGTKDGSMFELDIMTGQVRDTKLASHNVAVVHIFRYHQHLLTLDESGKLLVYDVPRADEPDSGAGPILSRTTRISDRFTFARMLGDKLWTATAPASRSASSSKGPTIRVYEPCAPGNMPPARTLYTTEYTGTVTSATLLPLRPEIVYLGHEGGHISVWSVDTMSCIQVLKVSTNDILALEGVGERLWSGNRKGQIHVYDVSQKPWLTTNIWMAHADHPVHMLVVDPLSIVDTGRYTLWSMTREAIMAWDGLLSVDWIDTQMTARQPDYCTFRDVTALICSWNIDSAKPTDLSGSVENIAFLEQLLSSVDSPDIIIFGFQEVIPLMDKKLTAKTLLFGGKSKEAGATADKVSSAYRLWVEKLTYAVSRSTPQGVSYVKVNSDSLVGLLSCVFVRADQKANLRDVDITTVKRGLGNMYGNKGAIVARMVLDDTSLCFINVHLAAGQSQKAARNADLNGILEDKAILPPCDDLAFVHGGDGAAILDHELVILNGDLNYRIDLRRENVVSTIAAGDLTYLLDHDQLRKEMLGNHAFRLRSFAEAPITFPPTYKFNRGTSEYDTSEKRRIPAWCDRVVYTKSPYIAPLSYRRYEVNVSDHKPVSAAFKLTVKSVDKELMSQVRAEVEHEWAKKERDLLSKVADAVKSSL